jgi:hypothetical protein
MRGVCVTIMMSLTTTFSSAAMPNGARASTSRARARPGAELLLVAQDQATSGMSAKLAARSAPRNP